MAQTEETARTDETADQCRAVTDNGERCSRPAQDDGFCHQHGPEDETVDDRESDGGESESSREPEQSNESASEPEPTPDPDDPELELSEENGGELDVMAVRDTVDEVSGDLIGHPLDGIIEISGTDDGWHVVVEVVERSSVPDTQDILGQYSVTLDESGGVTGYRLDERYRRGDEKER